MKLNNFSKGLSKRLDPTLIDLSQAVRYNNIDNTGELLTSALAFTSSAVPIASWMYHFKDTWLSGDLERDYVEYQNKLYFTEANSSSKKYDGVNIKELGIASPIDKLTTEEGADGLLYGLAMPLPPGNTNGVAFNPLGTGFAVAHDVSPYVTIYKQNGTTFEALDAPTVLPTGKGKALSYSPDGNYLAVAHEVSPFITVYKINNDSVTVISTEIEDGKTKKKVRKKDDTTSGKKHTKNPDPVVLPTGIAWDITWSADSVYLAVAHEVTPYVTIYKLASDVLTKLANPGTLPTGIGKGVAFSEDTTYLTVTHTTTPFVTIYKRAADVFTKLTNPATLPTGNGNGVGWSSDGTYMTVAHEVTPFITIYKRAADVFTKLADPATLPTGIGNDAEFNPTYEYMTVTHEVSPYVTIYKRAADVFTKLADPDVLPAGIAHHSSWKNDNTQLLVAHTTTPFITIYERNGDVFTKYKDPTTLQYVYTYYDSSEGTESAPSPVSDELELVAGKSVDIDGIVLSTNSFADRIRLYRLGADSSEYTLIVELEESDLTDNLDGTYSYNDNIPTIDAVGDLLESQNNQKPIDGLINLVEAYGMLFASKGSRVYYTKLGQPDYWPSLQFQNFAGDVTGILPVSDGIFVFTATNFEVIVGTTPETLSKLPSRSGQGCNNHKSCKVIKGQPIWSSNDGICTWRSGSAEVLSRPALGKVTFDIVNTAVHDETYYICLADGTLMAMDLRFGIAFKTISFDGKELTDLGVFDNTFYGAVDGKIVTLFTGEAMELSYLSPELTEGDCSVSKQYNNVYIRANGEFTVKILVDGLVVTQEDIKGNTIHDLKVPQERQRGSSIQFDIVGTGTVKEIEYKAIGRQNGR